MYIQISSTTNSRRRRRKRDSKKVQGLLEGLSRYIQNIELNRTPSELVLFEPEVERIHLMREIDLLKEEIEAVRAKLKDKTD